MGIEHCWTTCSRRGRHGGSGTPIWPSEIKGTAFGRPFINNPDLPARFKNGWPLDEDLDMSTWYSSGHGARGYTDFPTYEEQLTPA